MNATNTIKTHPPICGCAEYWPNQGHHPNCPVLRHVSTLEAELQTAQAEILGLREALKGFLSAEIYTYEGDLDARLTVSTDVVEGARQALTSPPPPVVPVERLREAEAETLNKAIWAVEKYLATGETPPDQPTQLLISIAISGQQNKLKEAEDDAERLATTGRYVVLTNKGWNEWKAALAAHEARKD